MTRAKGKTRKRCMCVCHHCMKGKCGVCKLPYCGMKG